MEHDCWFKMANVQFHTMTFGWEDYTEDSDAIFVRIGSKSLSGVIGITVLCLFMESTHTLKSCYSALKMFIKFELYFHS